MNRVVLFFCLIVLSASNLFPQQSDFPKLTGPYLGQKPPGMTPEIFAPEFISTEKFELNSIFSLDLKEFYFSILDTVTGKFTIMVTRNDLSRWSYPVIADFSGKYSDADPSFSPNGDKIFFLSDRPSNDEINKVNYDLWYVEKLNGHYGNPVNIGKPINTEYDEYYPIQTEDSTIYFQANRPNAGGGRDIYYSKLINSTYSTPQKMDSMINSIYREGDFCFSPDETCIVFVSHDRPDGFGSGDLYVSYLQEDKTWSKALNLGSTINTVNYEFCPMFSPDGKYLFFTRIESNQGDIYWVSAKIIENFKLKELK